MMMIMSMNSNVKRDERERETEENKQLYACQMPRRVFGYVRAATFANLNTQICRCNSDHDG